MQSTQLWSLEPFWNEFTSVAALITGATLLCFSFTGFDSLSSLAEETKDTEKTLPKAIFLTALLAGIIFIISTYFMQIFFPNDPKTYFEDIAATQPDILQAVGGVAFQDSRTLLRNCDSHGFWYFSTCGVYHV